MPKSKTDNMPPKLQNGNAWKIDKLVATFKLQNKANTEMVKFGLRDFKFIFLDIVSSQEVEHCTCLGGGSSKIQCPIHTLYCA